MLALRLEPHQVHDVDHPDSEIRQVAAKDRDSGQDLKRGRVPAAGHHHVGLGLLVVAGPLPGSIRHGRISLDHFRSGTGHDRLCFKRTGATLSTEEA